jgi:cellulose synthase/poly-beta-1,6-N-acetylglucosamine synthase-like glycosyltransferase
MPEVSVVMGVYDSIDTLDVAMESVLAQEGVDLELIVVDDGSTDGSGAALDRWAQRDPRVRVLHQENRGLTVALQRACEKAKGEFIARQDAGGDRSLPGRLKAQLEALRNSESAVAVSGIHRLVAMDGTPLCEVATDRERIRQGLSTVELPGMCGILHASSMFRAAAFEKVGGYRSMFAVAQDLDLWMRLFEVGEFEYVDRVIYDVRYDKGSISAVRQAEQVASARFAAACARARRSGAPEPARPEQDALPPVRAASERECRAKNHYYLAACLRKRDPRGARAQFLTAWLARPAMLKALFLATVTW